MFPETSRSRRTRHNVGFDHGRVIGAQNLKIVISALDNVSFSKVDAAMQGGGQTPGDPALHLPFDAGGIDGESTIENADSRHSSSLS